MVFTDEWGGGAAPRCRAEDPATWGANLIATITDRRLEGESFFKLPSVQEKNQNCVAHNGNIIPVPGRDLMVQAWYQGGVSIMDFTDPAKPVEIAYFDRGPLEQERMLVGGSWSAYWLNGRIYSSEIARGLDVLRLVPSDQLSAAEIAAADAVTMAEINPHTQTRITWTDSPDVAMAYLDPLKRTEGVDAALTAQVATTIDQWRAGSTDKAGSARLAQSLTTAGDAATGATAARFKALAGLFQRRSA